MSSVREAVERGVKVIEGVLDVTGFKADVQATLGFDHTTVHLLLNLPQLQEELRTCINMARRFIVEV